MAESNSNGIKIPTPFGLLSATGASAILAVLVLAIGIFFYHEMEKLGDEFESIRMRIDQRFKEADEIQRYQACLSRLTLWRAGQPREAPINFDILPAEMYYCLPKFLVESPKR